MKKDGFVFVESVVVLVVVALSLAMLISSYSLVSRKTKEKEKYDNTSDKYLIYAISRFGVDDSCNYSKKCGEASINFEANINDCSKMSMFLNNCEQVFNDMNLVYIYVVDNISNALQSDDALEKYDSGTIEYMKTLKKCNDVNVSNSTVCQNPVAYMIGVFEKGTKEYYYASIEL